MKIVNLKKSGKIDIFNNLSYLQKINSDDLSADLCFSIPVHEKQDVINNQIENILNFNPFAKIIIHINKSFKEFKRNDTQYDNVYINRTQYNYVFGKGLLWIHVQNFKEMIDLNVDFKYFVILSSNEMFIREGCYEYINKWKNGLQCIGFDKMIDWHNFHKSLENDKGIIGLIEELGIDRFYGGQTEGQFYERHIFDKIKDIYLKHFGDRELMNFETEEILLQTIFKALSLSTDYEWGLPITLQNYSNSIEFTEEFISNIIFNKDFSIPNRKVEKNLFSPHVVDDGQCAIESIFSIKRVDRTFNDLRMLLTRNGFLMNEYKYIIDRTYYSHGSTLKLLNDSHVHFKKTSKKKRVFQWFGYKFKKGGFYKCSFQMKANRRMQFYSDAGSSPELSWGIKIECSGIIYNFFTKDLYEKCLGRWKAVEFPFQLKENSMVLFFFDNYLDKVDIEFKDISIVEEIHSYHDINNDGIAIVLYNGRDNINYNKEIGFGDIINYNNVYNNIINPLKSLFNIYTFVILDEGLNNSYVNQYINSYLPNGFNKINISNSGIGNSNSGIGNSNSSIGNIKSKSDYSLKLNNIFIKCIDEVIIYKIFCNIEFKFIIMFDINSFFTQNITDFNFYINKLNFISYKIPYINQKITNSCEFISFPYKYVDDIYNLIKDNIENRTICYELYWKLKDVIGGMNLNFIFDENFASNGATPLIKYREDIDNHIKDGFVFDGKYIQYVTYYNKNKLAMLIKEGSDDYHFIKKETFRNEPFIWIGTWLDLNEIKTDENIRIKFSIKAMKEFKMNDFKEINDSNALSKIGIKTHDPILYYWEWINTCIIGEYTDIEFQIKINKNSQYIIFCFDDYWKDLDLYIRDFKIIMDY